MRDTIRDLLDSAAADVRTSRMLYVDSPDFLREQAVLKMDAALELVRVYRLLKIERENAKAPFARKSF